MEKIGSPTECKILQFPERKPEPKLVSGYGDLVGTSITAAIVQPSLHQTVADFLAAMMKEATALSETSGVPVLRLIEDRIRRETGINSHVKKVLADAMRELRKADENQRTRLAEASRLHQGPCVPDQDA